MKEEKEKNVYVIRRVLMDATVSLNAFESLNSQ